MRIWGYAYETSLTRDSNVVAHLPIQPSGAHIAQIGAALGTPNATSPSPCSVSSAGG